MSADDDTPAGTPEPHEPHPEALWWFRGPMPGAEVYSSPVIFAAGMSKP